MTEYSDGFRARMVERMTGPKGLSASMLAQEVGITQPTLSRWLREAATRERPSNPSTPRGRGSSASSTGTTASIDTVPSVSSLPTSVTEGTTSASCSRAATSTRRRDDGTRLDGVSTRATGTRRPPCPSTDAIVRPALGRRSHSASERLRRRAWCRRPRRQLRTRRSGTTPNRLLQRELQAASILTLTVAAHAKGTAKVVHDLLRGYMDRKALLDRRKSIAGGLVEGLLRNVVTVTLDGRSRIPPLLDRKSTRLNS